MGTKIAYLALVISLRCLSTLSGATSPSSLGTVPCGIELCNDATEMCSDENFCVCRPYFQRIDPFECVPCPGEGEKCRDCCSGNLTCYRNVCQRCTEDSNGNCISQESLFFLTAAQVALATAMVLGVISLSFLLYKTLRNRLRRNNQTVESDFRQSVTSRVSLSSIQQRVVRRLRDRPPKYETRHNYEYQQRQTERQNSQQSARIEDVRQRNVAPIGGPPPAYEGDTVSLAENPPPYTQEQTSGSNEGIAVIDMSSMSTADGPTEPSDNSNSANLRGITNPVFESDKLDQSPEHIRPPKSNETNGPQKEDSYDISLVNSGDKTLYM